MRIIILFSILLLCTISLKSQTYNGANGAIPDNNTWTSFTLNVSNLASSDCEIIVCIDITHTWVSDLDIELESPSGTTIVLTSDNGGSGNNYLNTCFDASSTTPIANGFAPFIGSYLPEGDLSVFNNQNPNGQWILWIRDDAWFDTGTLNSWSIEFNNCVNSGPQSGCTDSTAVNFDSNAVDDDGSCIPISPFCTDSTYTFPASVDVPSPGFGPNYDCLYTSPNPAWYYLQISESGDLVIEMYSDPFQDIDFIVWGPLNSYSGVFNSLNSSLVEDCSYSASGNETAIITNSQVGDIYIFLITNYSNQECNIIFQQTSGDGATDCDIVECNHNAGIGASIDFCSYDGISNLFDVLTDNPDSNGVWIPPLAGDFLGTFDPTNNSPGEYAYLVSDCDVSDTAFVTVSIYNANAGDDSVISLCDTDEPINLFDEVPGNPDQNGNWSPLLPNGYLGFFDPNQNLSGIYTYNVTINDCTDSSTINIQTSSVQPSPIIYD